MACGRRLLAEGYPPVQKWVCSIHTHEKPLKTGGLRALSDGVSDKAATLMAGTVVSS